MTRIDAVPMTDVQLLRFIARILESPGEDAGDTLSTIVEAFVSTGRWKHWEDPEGVEPDQESPWIERVTP